MGRLIVVAGAQFGSEGKGAVSDHLTRPGQVGDRVVAARVAGPNAGHTVFGQCPPECKADPEHMFNNEWIGHPWKLRTVPVAAVSNPAATLVIAAGSEVDRAVLSYEVATLDAAGYDVSGRLLIDPQATVLEPTHIDQELRAGLSTRLGSTAKGIGAARVDRLWRTASLVGTHLNKWTVPLVDTAGFMQSKLSNGYTVLIEGTQGYGLGLHAGHYPQCTSSDCRAIDFLAMAGLSPWASYVEAFEVWLAARVRPIRVAGNSGALKGETTWAELGLPEEHTTVTRKVRRVGEWDADLVRAAVAANGGDGAVKVALTMVDTEFPALAGRDGYFWDVEDKARHEADSWVIDRQSEIGARVAFVGTGPTTALWR